MAEKKESFFWTSYSDLMTSLFFIMLTLFVLVIVLLHKRMEATEKQLEEIKKVEASTKELGRSKNFAYKAEYKKYVLDVRCFFKETRYRLADLQADTARLHRAGTEIKEFLDKNENNQYLLIIEGQASRNSQKLTDANYDWSFQRALTLMKFWKDICHIDFGANCEFQIAGSGDGRYNFGYTGGEGTERFKQLDATLMRERGSKEIDNQRFVIHIIPKNIIEDAEKKKTKYYAVILCLSVLLFVSCAHKSGHRRDRERPGTTMADRSGRKSSRSASRKSKIVNKRSSDKLEGAQIFERYGSAVFMVFTTDGSNAYQGSGFFIDNEGLAVSNYHVFKGTGIGLEQIKLVGSDEAYKVTEVIQKSEQEDFILFRVDCENTNYIPIATDKPKIGEKVYAIGSPRGLENTFSSGEVSQWRADNLMQISALIDHGSSGGALINEYGEVVGITSGSFADGSQANLNYAWSIDAVKPYVR